MRGSPSGESVEVGAPSRNAATEFPATLPLKLNPPRGTLAAPRNSVTRR